jgi:hypothetical protein
MDSLLFPAKQKTLEGNKFKDDRELETVVLQWLIIEGKDGGEHCIEKVAILCDKCLNSGTQCVEK